MGKKVCRKVKPSSLFGDASSSLLKAVSPYSSPAESDSSPYTPGQGKVSSSSSIPRRFTRSMSIPFAAPRSTTISPTEPSMNHTECSHPSLIALSQGKEFHLVLLTSLFLRKPKVLNQVLKSSEDRPDVPTDGDFSSSSIGDGAFSVHSLMLSLLTSMILLSLSLMFSLLLWILIRVVWEPDYVDVQGEQGLTNVQKGSTTAGVQGKHSTNVLFSVPNDDATLVHVPFASLVAYSNNRSSLDLRRLKKECRSAMSEVSSD
uniref:Uncharacterized protein n=1 Tax=Cannabis sativa TaxID=3483 RepID=A0A803NJ83_CANSA